MRKDRVAGDREGRKQSPHPALPGTLLQRGFSPAEFRITHWSRNNSDGSGGTRPPDWFHLSGRNFSAETSPLTA